MIRFRYNQQVHPAAPYVYVILRPPSEDGPSREVPALVDTGADTTVVPLEVVEALDLPQIGVVRTAGFGGRVDLIPSHLVRLRVRGLAESAVKVLASPDESYVLLGRDVLNQFRLTLDGPGLALEIA